MSTFRSLISLAVALPRANLAVDQIVRCLGADRETRILLTGSNPCAGPRSEAAADALATRGIRSLISPRIPEPFATHCVVFGILPIVLARSMVRVLAADASVPLTALVAVDLQRQEIVRAGGNTIGFRVDPLIRRRLLAGRCATGDLLSVLT